VHKYYLFTVSGTGPLVNPGCHFISYGIRYLIHEADPDALFFDESLFEYNAKRWSVLFDQADATFLCGNPRYDRSNYHHYWLTDLWVHVAAARKRGILTGDLFGGSASPLPTLSAADDAASLLSFERNILVSKAQSHLDALVVRDPTTFHIAGQVHPNPLYFPCSAFWAPAYLGIKEKSKEYNAITIPALNCTPELIRALHRLIPRIPNNLPTYIITHCKNEWDILKSTLPDFQLKIIISDPFSLLDFYSRCSHLISCRLHASTPALALGAHVLNVAMDMRSTALEAFNVSSTPCTSILANNAGDLNFAALEDGPPSTTQFADYFRTTILTKLK